MKIINWNIEVPIEKVQEWQDNPRAIKKEDFERLKTELNKFGQFKTILCIVESSKYTVIAGNMRLKAMVELGFKKIRVTEVKVDSEAEKVELSLADNDRAGFYLADELAYQVRELEIDLKQYKVDITVPELNLDNIINIEEQLLKKEEDEELKADKHKCPKCGYKW